MFFYISLLVICLLASFLFGKSKWVGILITLLLFLISAGRGESVGIDTVNYYNNVFSIFFEGEIHAYEFFFIRFCDFVRDKNLNSRCCLYLLSFVTFFFLNLAARRYRESIVVICFFFLLFSFFTHSINISRQLAACSILLYGYSFLFGVYDSDGNEKNFEIKNILRFLLIVILATSFHSGAFLAIIVLPIYFLRARIAKLFVDLTPLNIFFLFFVFFAFIQIVRGSFLSSFQGLLTSVDIYKGYTTHETTLSIFGFFLKSIAYIFHGYILYYLLKRGEIKLGVLFFSSLIIRILLSAFYGVIFRFGLFFSIIDVVVYSRCFLFLSTKKKAIFYLALIYWGIEYVSILYYNTYETVPYIFKPIKFYYE